jgi:hypothetical protein
MDNELYLQKLHALVHTTREYTIQSVILDPAIAQRAEKYAEQQLKKGKQVEVTPKVLHRITGGRKVPLKLDLTFLDYGSDTPRKRGPSKRTSF